MSKITVTAGGPQTLQQVADTAQPGDIITVQPGQYAGFMMTRSGNPAQPIRFNALPGAQIITPVPGKGDGINLEGASWVWLSGFTCNGMGRAGIRSVGVDNNHRVNGIKISKCRCDSNTWWGIFTSYCDLVEILENTCSNSLTEHGIYVSHGTTSPEVKYNHCFGNNVNGIHINSGVGELVIEAAVAHNVIHDNGKAGGSGINCDGLVSSEIYNNLLYGNKRCGISLYKYTSSLTSTNNSVRNNVVVMLGADGQIVPNSSYALNIRNGSTDNTVTGNVFTSMLLDNDCVSGYVGIDNVIALPNGKTLYLSIATDAIESHFTTDQWAKAVGEANLRVLTPEEIFHGWEGYYERL